MKLLNGMILIAAISFSSASFASRQMGMDPKAPGATKGKSCTNGTKFSMLGGVSNPPKTNKPQDRNSGHAKGAILESGN